MTRSSGGMPETWTSSQYIIAGAARANQPAGQAGSKAKTGQAHQPMNSKK